MADQHLKNVPTTRKWSAVVEQVLGKPGLLADDAPSVAFAIHAPVRLDKRVVGYAKPVAGDLWQVEIDVSSYPSGSYTLQLAVRDRQGRVGGKTWEAQVRSDMVASAIDIDRTSLPTTPQIGFAWLKGRIAPVHKGARPSGVVVRVDGRDTQIYRASIKGERWSCMVPQQVFTRGLHTVEATALYARTSQKAEAKWEIL